MKQQQHPIETIGTSQVERALVLSGGGRVAGHFVSGCAENMPKFFPRFDLIILLSVPASVIVQRLHTRTTNQYGKRPDEVARVLHLVESIEPRLRRVAGYEINTSAPLEEVVVTLLRLVQSPP